jgi:argininosuccinate lyase
MSTLWSGRFDQAPDAAAFEWGSSFSFDRRLFEDDVTGSLAWARALAGAGVLTAGEAAAIQEALTAILEEGRRGCAQLRRAAARREARRHRQAPAHRAFAQ